MSFTKFKTPSLMIGLRQLNIIH